MNTTSQDPAAEDALRAVDDLLRRTAQRRWGQQAQVDVTGAVRGRCLTGSCRVRAGATTVWAGSLEEALRRWSTP